MKSCVVEIQDNVVIGLHICKDEKQAEEIFTDIAREQTDLTDDEIAVAVNDFAAAPDWPVIEIGEGSLCLYQGHEL